ncbi:MULTISPECIES: alpha-glutamyl/putrescinyl thymine pyrophosphorylase clade 3 protein [unclassified Phyllobacterium]|uniref:alpha-glutamyl/putrescinyl thymine pyrophosphorylase clade 3 protein n=1 Tax=unclassified Phyllobacterium TaxID=2638441 RepID=UPI0030131A11
MWPARQTEKNRLKAAMLHHAATVRQLPGISNPLALEALGMQFIASIRREDYYRRVQEKPISAQRANPNSAVFDAERAVAYHMQNGNFEEAAWLVFLMTHFARPADTGWLRLQDVYGMLGQGTWSWQTVQSNPPAFTQWLSANWTNIRGKFGNHRKYESLRPTSNRNMARVLASYTQLIGNSHVNFFARAVQSAGNNPETIFDHLYRQLGAVVTFGRLAKFDYLALIGRYGIAPISPGSAYLSGATGPASGVRLLFLGTPNGRATTKSMQRWLDDLDRDLVVGMQVMEDALCNWQKSPTSFTHFKG